MSDNARILAHAAALSLTATLPATGLAQSNDEEIVELVSRLDLESYKSTIRGLTQFGDRRQGTERNRMAVGWIASQLEDMGCSPERIEYVFDPEPRPPRSRQPRTNWCESRLNGATG